MSNNISDVKVWPLKKSHPTVKANGVFTVNDVLTVKFTLFNGEKGLWVGLPGKQGDKVDPETNRKPWYPDVKVINDDFRKQVNDAVIQAYNSSTGNSASGGIDQGEAQGPSNQDSQRNIPF